MARSPTNCVGRIRRTVSSMASGPSFKGSGRCSARLTVQDAMHDQVVTCSAGRADRGSGPNHGSPTYPPHRRGRGRPPGRHHQQSRSGQTAGFVPIGGCRKPTMAVDLSATRTGERTAGDACARRGGIASATNRSPSSTSTVTWPAFGCSLTSRSNACAGIGRVGRSAHPGNRLFYEYHSNESADPRGSCSTPWRLAHCAGLP